MKWVLIIVLIVVIMIIANSVSQQYKDKFEFYYNLKNFLNHYKINVSFKKEKILDFLNHQPAKKQFKLLVEDYKSYLETNELNLNNLQFLEDDERTTLSEILKNLGRFDTNNEINQLSNFMILIDEKLTLAQAEKNKLCPMIIKLSLLFALGLAIILI